MKKMTIAPLVIALAVGACKPAPTPGGDGGGPSSNLPANDPVQAGGEAKDAVAASNAFGLALYQELRAGEGNLAFSPASISVALAMTYAGARGKTADEMRAALRFPSDGDALHGGWATVLSSWQANKDVTVSVANRLFGEQKYSFETPYLDLTKQRYGSPLVPVDFEGAPEAQRTRINSWVAEQTHERIVDLIPPEGVTADTRMALVNAIYFKAKWQEPFNKDATAPGAFSTAAGEVRVPMMTQMHVMSYGEVDGVKLAERAYEGGAFATLFVLPPEGDDLASLEKKLDADMLARWTASLAGEVVHMTLPRFEIKPNGAVELSDALKPMGMTTPFLRGEADFSGMANPKNPEDRLFIGRIYHKAFVAMDEAGTEAAAASAVIMPKAGAAMPSSPKEFNANRPFLFFVRDTQSGLVVFVGRVANPAA